MRSPCRIHTLDENPDGAQWTLTGRSRFRTGLFGRQILQVEESDAKYGKVTPAAFAANARWRDATSRDFDGVAAGARAYETVTKSRIEPCVLWYAAPNYDTDAADGKSPAQCLASLLSRASGGELRPYQVLELLHASLPELARHAERTRR